MTTATTKEIDPQLISDVLTDAVESSGLNYWAQFKNITYDETNENVISFEVRDHGGDDGDNRYSEKWNLVNAQSIKSAVQKILSGEIQISKNIVEQFTGDDDWNYDADGIDCIVQISCFNELVFG